MEKVMSNDRKTCDKFYNQKFDLTLSTIGLGTVKFGRNKQVKYPSGENFQLPDDKTILTLLDTAIELGVNVIDTAPSYGTSEERIGKLLGNRRDKFNIFTKVGEIFDNEKGVGRYDFSPKAIELSIYESLKRLKVEYLEGVLLHCSANDIEILKDEKVFETLNGFKEKGLVKTIGASTMSIEGGLYASEVFDVLMVSFNRDYQAELPVIKSAIEKGKIVFIKKGLKSGHFKPEELADLHRAVREACADSCLILGTANPANLVENVMERRAPARLLANQRG